MSKDKLTKEELEEEYSHIISDSENDIDAYLEIQNRYDENLFNHINNWPLGE